MSVIIPSAEAPTLHKPSLFNSPARSTLIWTAIACVLLVGAGVGRSVQESQHDSQRSYKEVCPIDLATIPVKLGDWRFVDKAEKQLDDQTMKITGGTDHIFRTYVNDLTGVSLVVLILYGPAEPVLPHTPEICYPSSGFVGEDVSMDRTIKIADRKSPDGALVQGQGQFRSASYQKSVGRGTLREAVYHSFRLDGQWSPDIGKGRKFPRRNPGIFKVQVQRQIAGGEALNEGDPIEQFLSLLLGKLEQQVEASTTTKGLASK